MILRLTGSEVHLQQTPADLQQRGPTGKRKTNIKSYSININEKDDNSKIPSKGHQHQRPKVDKSTKIRKNQHKKAENPKNQNASSPSKDYNSSPAREQNWTENEFDK